MRGRSERVGSRKRGYTIIDLLVVFLFTHPLVALLARSSAFTSPRFSGLGNARSDKAIEAATRPGRFGAVRTKES